MRQKLNKGHKGHEVYPFYPRSITEASSPAGMQSRSGGTTSQQFERVMAATSPEPCQRTSSTSVAAYSPESTAGKNRVKPVRVFTSDFSRAKTNCNFFGWAPQSPSTNGRAKSSKVTMVETGFPGSPRKYVGWALGRVAARPKTTGLPG